MKIDTKIRICGAIVYLLISIFVASLLIGGKMILDDIRKPNKGCTYAELHEESEDVE